MQRFGGAVIPMQQILDKDKLKELDYLVGDAEILVRMPEVMPLQPFNESVINFLDDLSKHLLKNKEVKMYSDIVTFAFWIRKASILTLKKRFVSAQGEKSCIQIGRGMLFHIAPSNVPVNYVYSLVAGLLTGNANVVRVPSKEFPQIGIINKAIQEALCNDQNDMASRICLVRYHHQKEITEELSKYVDGRIIWGGDATIREITKCSIPLRAVEVTFADRYSIAVVDSDAYMSAKDKNGIAKGFYNDTYLTDQNACTSPRVVVWTGDQIEEAKSIFWDKLHDKVIEDYEIQDKQVVDKLTNIYMLSSLDKLSYHVVHAKDNYITRIKVERLSEDWMQMKGNSGFFFEYDCRDWEELREICSNTACQTISYYGESDGLKHLAATGIKGVDRIVPLGKTMDFDLIWDGYNLYEWLTKSVACL